jgi:beta-lactamase regulating signal transducer with metallopeptidase domain
MTPFVLAWWSWIVSTSVQGALLIALMVLLDRIVARRAWPGLQSALWFVVVAKLVLPASLWPAAGALPWTVAMPEGVRVASPALPGMVLWGVFVAWLGGVALTSMLAVRRHRRACVDLLTDSSPASARVDALAGRLGALVGLSRVPEVRVSDRLRGPLVIGILRPAILLPRTLVAHSTDEELEHVLLHELIHVWRKDALASAACLGLTAVYWFHPLVWMARRRLAVLREVACDARAAALSGAPQAYRRTLLRVGGTAALASAATGLGLFGSRSTLLLRVALLERTSPPSRATRAGSLAVFLGLLTLVMACAAATARPMLTATDIIDLPGSLQTRYAVYALLAAEAAASKENAR